MPFYYIGPKEHSRDRLSDLCSITRPFVAMDTETPTITDKQCLGFGIATDANEAYYFPAESPDTPWPLVEDASLRKVFHNVFWDLDIIDMNFSRKLWNLADTKLLAHYLNKWSTELSVIGPEETGLVARNAGDVMAEHKVKRMDQMPEEVVARKCMEDCMCTYALYDKWWQAMSDADRDYMDIEFQLIPILHRMSGKGLLIDHAVRRKLLTDANKDTEFYKAIASAEGFNPGSPQQVAYILLKRGNTGLRIKRNPLTHKMTASTDESVLELLDDPMATLTLNYRKARKLAGTYLEPLEGEPRCYTNFHMDARTGRISSGGSKEARNIRNLQNIPPDIRCMFLPDSGIFTDADYSQIELRVLAHMTQDPDMLLAFERDLDIHQDTADFMGIQRKIAKNVNFACVYGATPMTVMQTAKLRDYRRAQELLRAWSMKYRVAWNWLQDVQRTALRTGYTTTLYNRMIKLPMNEETDEQISRKATNYPIQGGAAEIVKRAMIRCWKAGLLDQLALQVHDELMFDGDVREQLMGLSLDHIAPFHTPLKVKMIERWE